MSQSPENRIRKILHRFRTYIAAEHFRTGLIGSLLLGTVLLGIAITAESLWYLDGASRTRLLWITGGTVALVLFGSGLWVGFIGAGGSARYSDFSLAKRLGQHFPALADHVANALALIREKKQYHYSKDLIDVNLKSVAKQLEGINPRDAVASETRQFLARGLGIAIGLWLVLWLPFFGSVTDGASRLFHPNTTYEIPQPFTFEVSPGNVQVLNSDPVPVTVSVDGELPDDVLLTRTEPNQSQTIVLTQDSTGHYRHKFRDVRRSFEYTVHAQSPHWWDRWDEIRTETFRVQVMSRPQIQSLAMRLVPPEYSDLEPRQQEITSTEIVALKGTKVELTGKTNKPVKSAEVGFESRNASQSMDINETDIRSSFRIMRPDAFSIRLKDFQDIANTNPANYKITPLSDEYPRVEILQPQGDVDLGESLQIPFLLRLQDDYGFSKLAVQYQIVKPAASDRDTTWKTESLPLSESGQKVREYTHRWDLNPYNLSPRDMVRYRIAVWDNDRVSGPKVSHSQVQTARFPSLSDMFARTQQQQSGAMEQAEEIRRRVEKIKKQVDELTLEMQKKEEITWQQEQQAENIVKSHEELKKQLDEVSKQLDNMLEEAKKHQLFSEELAKKYQELQQVFQDVMTPELEEALKQLQQAMDQANPEEVRKAMENLQQNEQDLTQSIDRALKLFKRVQIEQQMDEVVKRISELAEQQQNIADKADSASADARSELSQEEQLAADEYEIAEKRMEQLAKSMEEFPVMPSEQMKEAVSQAKMDSILRQMRQSQQSFQQGQMQSGQQRAQQSSQRLKNLANQLQQTQQALRQQTMNEVLDEFRAVLRNVLSLSQQQEALRNRTAPLQGKSPQLGELADEQQSLQMNLQRTVGQLIQLSQKTFGVTRDIGKALGNTASNMQRSVQSLAERQASQAANRQGAAMASLNETAQQLVNAMNNLQSQGSSTGFENYLKQMQQMASQQQSLNQQSQQQLGQQGNPSPAQQAAMQRLAARQMGIRQSLQQMQQEMSRSGESQGMGDMRGMTEEMKEVEEDLRNKRFTRETIERQQKILSRMLDATRSMRTRDFSKKRESQTGEEVVRSGPAGLPENYGERRNLIQESLDQALREGYSQSYESVIRNYFNSLSETQTEEAGSGE
ncbi:MAG: hypothetical protein K9N46_15885 [Candidatus Marinimicrobia bacterium]|nr:hypothetical protein [Candidatus Neomarinimicrobiota bacterium]MCF7830135.1 hypothetical protein [Candidatus Neomarinimicrobiota bacterium]MCF7882212.1 hypothetical protein [Candidatus Neomarinimicrobiota bacterium]